eukprot:CAMPEP_0206420782 /NCGR_PEP_ID=MMETSP0324_2-20121206/1067_1 /ASSEMBLY_ACC=CAM_ASM_000836 /TAXON_ID=2866 /ORGANISM="Crypthecodinium cohnii, Strain Seligo" /LENGTH=91 /DNA_ID=CAMNT_0053884771 /DNA_START=358 /DNA_END=633 /DNA_ORIENTATION=-
MPLGLRPQGSLGPGDFFGKFGNSGFPWVGALDNFWKVSLLNLGMEQLDSIKGKEAGDRGVPTALRLVLALNCFRGAGRRVRGRCRDGPPAW